ncbi:NnrS family protein [Oscillatoria laete-virens NRMC-F 0139]|nr:NnrS family protein [Oscillatoria laete-virens]MDL5053160.1 NnrS family protein [Oscillatoria laete-virens NRMC-F 0139]
MQMNGNRTGYWRLAMGEPFRLLFPVGSILGILGVALWPLHHTGLLEFYPNLAHERIMIQGFITCFVIGFLGTALPRVLDVPRLTALETPIFAFLILCVAALHLARKTFWGDVLFVMTMGAFVLALIVRAILRRDIPPPGFVLVPMGMVCGVVGYFILAVGQVTAPEPFVHHLARLLSTQGYLLLPVMGIGAFLLPRFFGQKSRHHFPESLEPPPGWMSKAAFSAMCGGLVLLGFVLEAAGHARSGMILRAAVILTYFLMELNPLGHLRSPGALALALRLALVCFPLGLILAASDPGHRIALMHVFFIGGFGLLTYTVATRVVLGHTGQSDQFTRWSAAVVTLLVLAVLTIASRVTADYIPALRLSHYDYAAICWIIAIVVWLAAYGRHLGRADEE